MKNPVSIFALASILLLTGCKFNRVDHSLPGITYPVTFKGDVSDNYFGTTVADPYRWLENDTAPEVEAWVQEQNKITFSFLSKIPFREKIKTRLTEITNFARVSGVIKAGDYILYEKNDGLQNQPVIYRRKGIDGKDEVLIDANTLSSDGTIAVDIIGISEDKKYVTYSKSVSGSDWKDIFIKEIATGNDLSDHIRYAKFTGTQWYGDGFFYSRFPEPARGKELQQINQFQKVYYHKLGEPQEKDILIFEDPDHPLRYHSVGISDDRKYLFLYVSEGTDGFECYYKKTDLKKGGFKPLFTGFEHKSSVIEHIDGKFLVHTDIDAPNYRVIALDPENPGKGNWKEIIPESNSLLEYAACIGGKLFAMYLKDVSSHLYQYSYDGKQEKEIEFPEIGSASLQYGDMDEDVFFYSFTSYNMPAVFYAVSVSSGEQSVFFRPDLKFDPEQYQITQVFYPSKDGTKIPMFIIHKKGLKRNGKNPALLYGYGGFSASETPFYSSSVIALLEYGAVFAVANLRGGNEYGEEWHKAGMLLKKQNVFDDFIAAAEYLIGEKYTSSDKLGIYGGSNGGLLVGACMAQRPELFKVAIPMVGVMDMLRFHKFTVGFGWVDEYGSSDDSVHFNNLYAYSPLHNLKKGVSYPATLVTTSDHDDRVVPAHSFKFIATLQEMNGGTNPVLIRIETKAGHGAGKSVSKVIDETADKWAFFLYVVGAEVK